MSRNLKKTREESLVTLFGPSGNEVPTESLTYIRKNPKRFISLKKLNQTDERAVSIRTKSL